MQDITEDNYFKVIDKLDGLRKEKGDITDAIKAMKKAGTAKQLKGYYMINKKGQIYCIDFIQDLSPLNQ